MKDIDLSMYGLTGLNRQGGFIYEEFLSILQGVNGIKIYNEMSNNDPTIGGILRAIDLLIRGVEWRFEPYDNQPEDIANARFMEEVIGDMSNTWHETISEIMSMLVFGWSYHEIVYKIRLGDNIDPTKRSKYFDGKIGIRKLAIRSQETLFEWDFDEEGGIQGMIQQAPPDYMLRYIPIEKALLFRTTSQKGNPEGKSILRNAYRPWYMKKNIENIEGIGVERDLAGLPVAWVPPELLSPHATPDERNLLAEIKKIIRNVRRDEQEGVIFPLMYEEGTSNKVFDLQLLSSNSRRQFDTDKIIQRYDQRIALTVLADFILLGSQSTGSYALSADKTRLFSEAISAWLDSISSVMNRHLIPRLFQLNGFDVTRLPKLVHGSIDSVDLQPLGEYIKNLSGAGMPLFPDDTLEDFLRTQAGLPVKGASDEVL